MVTIHDIDRVLLNLPHSFCLCLLPPLCALLSLVNHYHNSYIAIVCHVCKRHLRRCNKGLVLECKLYYSSASEPFEKVFLSSDRRTATMIWMGLNRLLILPVTVLLKWWIWWSISLWGVHKRYWVGYTIERRMVSFLRLKIWAWTWRQAFWRVG